MTDWVKREHSKSAIDKCGKILVDWWIRPGDMELEPWIAAYAPVKNWRLCHALPLNVIQAGLRWRIRTMRLSKSVIVAQRLKRFSSILNKLAREPKMKLTQMQDLGGCRAILPDIGAVKALYELYCGRQPLLLEENSSLKLYDYLTHPKPDGYRGIHIVARYHPRKGRAAVLGWPKNRDPTSDRVATRICNCG
jgi:hypothetical protein